MYAVENGRPLSKVNTFFVRKTAARGGHLPILQWVESEGYKAWDAKLSAYAAQAGQINVLEWARERGFPFAAYTSRAAAYGGHKKVLLWLRANGFPHVEDACSGAASMVAR